MNICIIGGIFDKDEAYRRVVTVTPETVLAAELQARGHSVETRGHWAAEDLSRFDIVHVHHLGPGAIRCATDPGPARFVFTNHASAHSSTWRAAAFRMVSGRADAVVALSPDEATWQRRVGHVQARQDVIPNGIDDTIFRYTPPRVPGGGDEWRLLYVGQLIPLKGVQFLLEALEVLQRDLPVRLDLVYHIDTQLDELRDLVQKLHLRGVRFLGRRSPRELADLYAASDVFVLPSTAEALPSVIAEAMLVGRPTVASAVGGIPWQVGSFGRVVPPRAVDQLADAIRSVIDDHPRYREMAAEASSVAAARFSVSAMADRHEALYERLRDAPARRRRWRYEPGSWLAGRTLDLGWVQRHSPTTPPGDQR